MSNLTDALKDLGGDSGLLKEKDVEKAWAWAEEKLKDPFILTTAIYIGDAKALIPEGEKTTLSFDALLSMVKEGSGTVHLAVASRVDMLGLDAVYFEAVTNTEVAPHLDELRALHNELSSDLRDRYLKVVELLTGLFRLIPGLKI